MAGFVDFTWEAAELHSSDRGLREIMLSNDSAMSTSPKRKPAWCR